MYFFRVAIIADIHGTLPALEAVLEDIRSDPVDQLIVAGDFLGGPQPVETLDVLREASAEFILGNGEVNMLKFHHQTAPGEWWTHRQFDLARWIYRQLDADIFRFLEELPEQQVVQSNDSDPVRVVHGSPWDVNKLVFPRQKPHVMARALKMIPEDVLVFAHNHLPDVIWQEGKLAVNPGSVSNNLDGDTRASYATLTWDGEMWQPQLHFILYDLGKVVKTFKETGFLNATRPLARGFLESILTGENTAMEYILFAFQKAKEAGYGNIPAIPDEIWLSAEETFPWVFEEFEEGDY